MEIIQAGGTAGDFSKFERAVDCMEGLETVPAVTQRLLSLTSDPNASFEDLEQLVGTDPALTARVLRVAASPLYGGNAASNLQAALVRIGMKEVRNLALTASLTASSANDFHRELWRFSLSSAVLAETLATRLGKNNFQEPFVCALLHELGTLVMAKIEGAVYENLVGTIGGPVQAEREQQLLGFTHGDIGALAAERWRLFDGLCQVIQFHHDPLGAELLDFPPAVLGTIRLVALAVDVLHAPDADSDQRQALLDSLSLDVAGLQEALEQAEPRIEEYLSSLAA